VALVQRALCDVCGTDKAVSRVTVVWDGDRSPWEADICPDCYQSRFADLIKVSRRAGRSNVRQQHRFEKIEDDTFNV
jgi:hypothetical protein